LLQKKQWTQREEAVSFHLRGLSMRNLLWACAGLVFWGLTTSAANAYYGPPLVCCYPVCPPPCCVAYETRVVTCYRTEWHQEKVPIVIQKVNYRPETIKVKVTVYVPAMFDQKVQTCYYIPVPKVVVQDVVSCVWVPFSLCDPCTGCCYTSCCPQWVTRKVQYTVCDYLPQVREDVVKVCKMVPQEQIVDQTRLIPVVTQEQGWTVRYSCTAVPYQTTVNVPVYVPCCP
jgi:hypothetical protein